MLTDANIRTLKSINSIESLLAFLKHDLQWPLADGDVDEVTFSYEPSELGLKDEHLPKINKVYQIRQISSDQPWGIFFIDFENKKLPISLMRRILNHLRVKNRGGSGQWDTGDLLFMTTYGQEVEGMREVAFAHFHQKPGDLPTLNVLQWDAQDTAAKLKTTYDSLRTNLAWPEDTKDQEAWRAKWRKPFRHKLGHTITTSSALAEKLAELSRVIRDRCNEILDAENEKGNLTKLYRAFQSSLIHDLKPEDFADTFAQTIAYGLFTAAVSRRHPEEKGSSSLTTDTISQIVPETSPFLREVLETFVDVSGRRKGIDFDEVGVQDIVDLLRSDETDMRAILADFGNRKPGEDPVIHFYEHYLAAYNKELKVKRGVFYTPQPVVSYIVRSVHELLQTEFGIEDGLASTITWGELVARGLPKQASTTPKEIGLFAAQPSLDDLDSQPSLGDISVADNFLSNRKLKIPEGTDPDAPFVVILDPATGTATFLVEAVDVIWKHLLAKWKSDPDSCWSLLANPPKIIPSAKPDFQTFWNVYVPDNLLPRLYGYELMMAPYAIAHMKMGLKLAETGYKFVNAKRVRIYLTNALEPASQLQPNLALDWEALAHEAQAVASVKESVEFTVVIGNPPYSYGSSNCGNWISNLIKPYYYIDTEPLNEKNSKGLRDDYVKFIRLGETLLQSSSIGILGLITNNGYIDNPTFRGMRKVLLDTFSTINIIDLHGNTKKKESLGDGNPDQNVFDIQTGVGIFIGAISLTPDVQGSQIFNLYGTRASKYEYLQDHNYLSTCFLSCDPTNPFYLFRSIRDSSNNEYLSWLSMPEMMIINSVGIATARDSLTVQLTKEESLETTKEFAKCTIEEAREKFELGEDSRDWTIELAKKDILSQEISDENVKEIIYRPFDLRYIYYTGKTRGFISMPRFENIRHMFHPNLAIYVGRQGMAVGGEEWNIAFGGNTIQDYNLYRRGNNVCFPLWIYDYSNKTLDLLEDDKRTNFKSNVITQALEIGGPQFEVQDCFYYIYAILFSPDYRSKYHEYLRIDFPRIPFPITGELLSALAQIGHQLFDLHTLTEKPARQTEIRYFQKAQVIPATVGKISYSNNTVYLDQSREIGFSNIPLKVWEFKIGGYQVCEKWLKDRGPKKGKPGRVLSTEDIVHYQKIVVAVSETIRIMGEIDNVIASHGGWPGAFQVSPAS